MQASNCSLMARFRAPLLASAYVGSAGRPGEVIRAHISAPSKVTVTVGEGPIGVCGVGMWHAPLGGIATADGAGAVTVVWLAHSRRHVVMPSCRPISESARRACANFGRVTAMGTERDHDGGVIRIVAADRWAGSGSSQSSEGWAGRRVSQRAERVCRCRGRVVWCGMGGS